MVHRGPDDAGADIIEKNGRYIGLAHRRLSIIDLSENGHQPMVSDDGSVEIVYNGEVYNFKELRQELPDYPYKSDSDTEVLLAAYKKWGMEFINKCNGMFAIAIYDRSDNTLYLIRDRMGQKPLYYYYKDGEVVFASELKAIMKYPGIRLNINRTVLGRYLVKNCIASPDTIFEDTFKVCPGEMIVVKDGKIVKKKYWDINAVYKRVKNTYRHSYSQAKRDIEAAIQRATKYRLISDVPIGVLLSGGYDSSIVAMLAQRESKNKINTYSIGMDETELDEVKYAKDVADKLGTEHHEQYISSEDMLKLVKEIPKYYDEPFADSSQIATMLVFKMAGKDATVVLSGDGGDELFAGYPFYNIAGLSQILKPFAMFLRRVAGDAIKRTNRIGYAVDILGRKDSDTQFNYLNRIDTVRKMINNSNSENYSEDSIPAKKWSIRRMLLDMQTYLPDDIHCKVDRASMMFSVESRTPFMDVNVIELALSMPQRYKLRYGKSKAPLKDIAWNHIGRELMDRPKQGFEVPIGRWMKGELKGDLMKRSRRDYLEAQGVFNPAGTEWIINEYIKETDNERKMGNITMIIWSFYIFQLWWEMLKTGSVVKLND